MRTVWDIIKAPVITEKLVMSRTAAEEIGRLLDPARLNKHGRVDENGEQLQEEAA